MSYVQKKDSGFSLFFKANASKIAVIVFLIASTAFLIYKLITYPDYYSLFEELKTLPVQNFLWLALTFVLLPFNWLTESAKWKLIVSETQEISLLTAFKSVLAGFSTGFFTPNRLGDFAGRIYFLKHSNRKTGILLSAINSLTQNVAIALFGIPAALVFFSNKNSHNIVSERYFVYSGILFLLLLIVFVALPQISRAIKSEKISEFLKGISNYTLPKQLGILGFSALRFIVFAFQFYAMLRFFGVNLTPSQALISIPAIYLFVTFTPSVAFSDPVIRSSYAVFFIGAFSAQTVGIALAGTGIWIINYLISTIPGNIFIAQKANRKISEKKAGFSS